MQWLFVGNLHQQLEPFRYSKVPMIKRKLAQVITIQYCLFNLSLAIRSKINAYEMLGTAILKGLEWDTKGVKNENLSQSHDVNDVAVPPCSFAAEIPSFAPKKDD